MNASSPSERKDSETMIVLCDQDTGSSDSSSDNESPGPSGPSGPKKYQYRKAPHYQAITKVRQSVAKALGDKFNHEKNGEILEKHVYNATISTAKQREIPLKISSPDFQRLYAEIAYEVLNSAVPLKKTIDELKAGQIFWKSPHFETLVRNREAEETNQDREVEDGIHQCRSCGSKKTKSYPLQTRSADEGMTIFIKCTNPDCGKMWKQYN